jgi:hypothetical protein
VIVDEETMGKRQELGSVHPCGALFWRASCAVFAVGLLSLASVDEVASQDLPPLTTTTPQYKCHVQRIDGGGTIIQFRSRVDLPARFSDADTFAQAPVPNSVKAGISVVNECVRMPEQFSDPSAVMLEGRLPK